jgi:hypothetical protein
VVTLWLKTFIVKLDTLTVENMNVVFGHGHLHIDTEFKLDIILKKYALNQLFQYFCVAHNAMCIHVRLRTLKVQLWAENHPNFIRIAFLIQDVGFDVADNVPYLLT